MNYVAGVVDFLWMLIEGFLGIAFVVVVILWGCGLALRETQTPFGCFLKENRNRILFAMVAIAICFGVVTKWQSSEPGIITGQLVTALESLFEARESGEATEKHEALANRLASQIRDGLRRIKTEEKREEIRKEIIHERGEELRSICGKLKDQGIFQAEWDVFELVKPASSEADPVNAEAAESP